MEKFALLNLLKALETLSPQKKNDAADSSGEISQNKQPENRTNDTPATPVNQPINVMSSVLERHEEIANRIKNNRR